MPMLTRGGLYSEAAAYRLGPGRPETANQEEAVVESLPRPLTVPPNMANMAI